MGRNPEKDAIQMAATNRRILENGFRVFTEKTIEKANLTDVAEAANLGIASIYRYYPAKQDLVLAVGAWAWETYYREYNGRVSGEEIEKRTGAEDFECYLESFLDLYRSHRDLLRFNQFFNMYLLSEGIPADAMNPYTEMIRERAGRFSVTYRKGREDGTLRTDLSEKQMFSVTLHLMLAVVTRYAVGLAYMDGTDVEKELNLQKRMLLREFVAEDKG
ncbi:MAG: TetR/AcrR family transcriptional regulator [Clostridia bacterium]|nr:TetR/AcrR family transcriptional regulator [Clostridia bacterium]